MADAGCACAWEVGEDIEGYARRVPTPGCCVHDIRVTPEFCRAVALPGQAMVGLCFRHGMVTFTAEEAALIASELLEGLALLQGRHPVQGGVCG